MTPQDTVIHLRTMADELNRAMGDISLSKPKHETYRDRVAALNSAIAMIELGTWVDPKDVIYNEAAKQFVKGYWDQQKD